MSDKRRRTSVEELQALADDDERRLEFIFEKIVEQHADEASADYLADLEFWYEFDRREGGA
jgi:hypothetical protein